MAEIISIANNKGGVGKTLTAFQMADYFSKQNKKTLLIDLDEQRNLSIAVGLTNVETTSYDILITPSSIKSAIIKLRDNLCFIASSDRLASLDTEQSSKLGKEQKLKEALEQINLDIALKKFDEAINYLIKK